MITMHWIKFTLYISISFNCGVLLASMFRAAGEADEMAEEIRDDNEHEVE